MATAGKTSLANQLERLKLPQTSAHRETHGAASFLYDFFEAKTIDAETHYSVAVAGLESLAATVNDPAVAAFRETLFSESSKSLDRGVLSAERNAAIDALLEEYLYRVVSRYFAHADTHRTIEWLLYRYRANEYNTEALIGSVLPYHETRHFVRLLQTVSAVKNPRNSLWSWLKPIQESGVPLTKAVLLNYCTRPTGLEFIRFITDSVFKGTAVDGAGVTFPSFLTSFCVNLLERTSTALKSNNSSSSSKPEQTVLLMVISVVSKAMRSSKATPQLFTAAYLIFAHLCTTTRLQADVVESFLRSLLKRLKSSASTSGEQQSNNNNYEGVLMALTIVVHSQALTKLPAKYLNDELVANLAAVIAANNSHTNSASNINISQPAKSALSLCVEEPPSSTASSSSPYTLERYKAYCDQLLTAENGRQGHLTRGTVFALVGAVNCAIKEQKQKQQQETSVTGAATVDELFTHLLQTLKTACPVWFEKAIDSLDKDTSALLLRYPHLNIQKPKVEAPTAEKQLVNGDIKTEDDGNSAAGIIIIESLEPAVEALDRLCEELRGLKPHEITSEQAVKVLQALATVRGEQEEADARKREKKAAKLLRRSGTTAWAALLGRQLTELLIDQAWTGKLSRPVRIALLGLLAAVGDVGSKAAVFKYYYGRLFERSGPSSQKVTVKAMITAEDEKEILALLASLNIDQEELFAVEEQEEEDEEEEEEEEDEAEIGDRRNYVTALYLAAIELPVTAAKLQGSRRPLSRDFLFGLYHFLTKATFDRLRALNPPFALQLIVGMLQVQLTLSETATSSTDISGVIVALKARLRRLNTDGHLITAVLQHLLPVEKVRDAFGYASKKSAGADKKASEGPSLPEAKRLRTNSGSSPSDSKFTAAWKLLRIYMSTFQSKVSIENVGALMRTLFDYLRLTFMELGDNSAEYTRQTLLYTVANCVEAVLGGGEKTTKKKQKSKDSQEPMEVDEPEELGGGAESDDSVLPAELAAFNVDIIVDCMRESRVRETQRLALLLIGQVAAYFRRPLLDYLVEIFTFIGTSLQQCDDQYSLQILFQTLEAVLPIALEGRVKGGKVMKKKKKKMDSEPPKKPSLKEKKGKHARINGEVVEEEEEVEEAEEEEEEEEIKVEGEKDIRAYVVSIFVKAFPDVPSYRRLPLFTKLIVLLGERQYLPIVSVRLLEEAVLFKGHHGARAEREVVQSFLLALLASFPPKTQLETLCTLLDLFDRKFFDHHLKARKGRQQQMKAEDKPSGLLLNSPTKRAAAAGALEEFTAASEAICSAFTSRIAFDSDKAACGVEHPICERLSRSRRTRTATGPGELADSPLLIHMLSQLLEMIVSLGEGGGTSASNLKPTLVAYRRRIKATLDEALLKYHRLLSSRRLIEVVTEELLLPQQQRRSSSSEDGSSASSPSDGLVKRKALELLNEKLLKMAVEEMAPELALAVLRSLAAHLITKRKRIDRLDELALHNLQLTVAAVKFATRFIQGSGQTGVVVGGGGSKRKRAQTEEEEEEDSEEREQHRQQQNEVLSALLLKVGQMTAAIELVGEKKKGQRKKGEETKDAEDEEAPPTMTTTTTTITASRRKSLQNLKGSCLLTLTQLLVSMSLDGLAHLGTVVELVLTNLEEVLRGELLGGGGTTGFAAFLSQAHLRSILLHLLEVASTVATTTSDQVVTSGLRSKLTAAWTLLARQVPKRALFEAIDAVYEETATGLGPRAVVELMALFRLACDSLQRAEVELMVKSFQGFMIKALEYRSRTIETAFGEAFSAFIPKLNEATFRPIFYRLLEWALQIEAAKKRRKSKAKSGGGGGGGGGSGGVYLADVHYHRMIAFYRFTSLLADRLKSLFCVFVAPSVVGNAAEMLAAYHSDHFAEEEDQFGTQKMEVDGAVFAAVEGGDKASKKAVAAAAEQLKLRDPRLGEPLVGAILSTLSKCFLYDLNGAFVNKDVTSMIVKPIVNQISNLFGTAADFETRLGLILQCTQYLIQNNKDEALIKEFNYQILLKTREANEKVRVGAIKVLHRLILTCSEDYLPFIPEAIPFIAELSEDDAESVEAAVKKLIVDIEQLVGEPINKYL
ncbi:HEAT repeat-containing protein 1 [Tyrophagus putrescentiae]|nr:HEAT repeat-containing protein 1 [Tyrophagus putrescentiae]